MIGSVGSLLNVNRLLYRDHDAITTAL